MRINCNIDSWKQFAKITKDPIAILIIISLAMAYVLNTYIIRFAVVSGESMYPTLTDRDILLVNQVNYEPSRGDIVLIDISESALLGKYIVKRIIATEGDTISLDYEGNSVYVNGVRVSESYINHNPRDPMEAIDAINNISYQVPPGTVFVMGDNRNESIDSRSDLLGMIEKTNVVGKVCLHFSPFRYFS